MSRFIDPQSAPTNIADLIGSIVRDAQSGIETQRKQKIDDEEALFQKAIDLAELEISRGEFNLKANPIQKPPTLEQMVADDAARLSPEDKIKLLMRLTGKDQIKAKADAKTAGSTSASRTAEVKGFLKTRETSEVLGKKTITTQPPFTQATRDSINAIVQGEPFPVFEEEKTIGSTLTKEQAQHRAALNQKYGEKIVQQVAKEFDDFDSAPFEDKVKTIETLLKQRTQRGLNL